MWKKRLYVSLLGCAAISVILFLGFKFDLNKSEWASWVQAVGSISAILAAAAIASWQSHTAQQNYERRKREDRINKALAIKYILRRAKLVLDNAERSIAASSHAKDIAIEQVDFMQLTLRSLPVFETPSPELVFFIQRTDRDMTYIRVILQKAEHRIRSGKNIPTAIFERVNKRLTEATDACDKVIESTASHER
jgi:hypothetical protein